MGFYKDPKRKDWIYRFQYLGKNYGGRGFKTKKEAVAARETKRTTLKYQMPEAIGITFSEACDLYLDFAQRRFTIGVYKYKRYVYKCFYQFIGGDICLTEITPKLIAEYLITRHSNNNYNVHRRELSAFLTYCEDVLEKLTKNPCKKITKLPHTVAEKQIPQKKDIVKLISVSDQKTDEKDLLMVLLHTLARIDEIFTLDLG